MWLKEIKFEDKTLSPVELLVLSNISNEFVDAPTIIHTLDEKIPQWQAERGTIYPLLHRLSNQHLLEKKGGRPLKFRRTNSASSFLSNLVSTDQLIRQFDASTRYLEVIASNIIQIDPFSAEEFLEDFKNRMNLMCENIDQLLEEARTKQEDDDWHEISVD